MWCTLGHNYSKAQILHEDFEDFLPNPTGIMGFWEAGFNLNGAPGWIASTGTPSACYTTNPFSNPNAPSNWACLGTNTGGGQCWEGVAATLPVPLVVGRQYTLTFDARIFAGNIVPPPPLPAPPQGNIRVGLSSAIMPGGPNTLCALDPINPPGGFIPIQQQIGNVFAPQAWGAVPAINFVATSASTQLHFLIGNAWYNIGIDNICLRPTQPYIPTNVTYVEQGTYRYYISPANFDASVTSITIDWGDGTITTVTRDPNTGLFPAFVDHQYNGLGTYSFTVTLNNSSCFTATALIPYLVCDCYGPTTYLQPSPDPYLWDTDRLIEHDVVLLPGAHLTVNNAKLRINSGCKFVVTRGASMVVQNNSLLTNNCPERRWNAISVWGNRTIRHEDLGNKLVDLTTLATTDPGVLYILSGSTVENMDRAIEAQPLWFDPTNQATLANTYGFAGNMSPAVSGGGVIKTDDATFRSNPVQFRLHDYPFSNYSRFDNTRFFTQGTKAEGVNIWLTNGVNFSNCQFQGTASRGISALNAGITVVGSLFSNIEQAMAIGSITTTNAFTRIGDASIDRANDFWFDGFGIWSDGIAKLEVKGNSFDTYRKAGIQLGEGAFDSKFEIVDNLFYQSLPNLYQTLGINVQNAGNYADDQDIFCNKHENDQIGLSVRGRCSGLRFEDNDYTTHGADVRIGAHWFGGTVEQGAIYYEQGSHSSPADNLFGVGANNELVTQVINQVQTVPFTYFISTSSDPIALERLEPDCPLNNTNCSSSYNFKGVQSNQPYAGRNCLVEGPTPYTNCENKQCMQDLHTVFVNLKNDYDNQKGVTLLQLQRAEADLNQNVQQLFQNWAETGEWANINEIVGVTKRIQDKRLYLDMLINMREFSESQALIDTWKTTETVQLVAYADIQQVYLRFLQSYETRYEANDNELAMLRGFANEFSVLGSVSRSLLHLLVGEIIIPEFDAFAIETMDRSVSTLSIDSQLEVYPNPVSEKCTISTIDASYARYYIYNGIGKIVQSGLMYDGKAEVVLRQNSPMGIYTVKCTGSHGEKPLISKFFLNR
jgi:hypothetical protein